MKLQAAKLVVTAAAVEAAEATDRQADDLRSPSLTDRKTRTPVSRIDLVTQDAMEIQDRNDLNEIPFTTPEKVSGHKVPTPPRMIGGKVKDGLTDGKRSHGLIVGRVDKEKGPTEVVVAIDTGTMTKGMVIHIDPSNILEPK